MTHKTICLEVKTGIYNICGQCCFEVDLGDLHEKYIQASNALVAIKPTQGWHVSIMDCDCDEFMPIVYVIHSSHRDEHGGVYLCRSEHWDEAGKNNRLRELLNDKTMYSVTIDDLRL